MTGLLAADIGLQLGGVEIGSKWEWREMGRRFSERLLKGAVNQANLAAFYYDGKQKKYRVAEYMPSPEDLEAVAEENTAGGASGGYGRGEFGSCQEGTGR